MLHSTLSRMALASVLIAAMLTVASAALVSVPQTVYAADEVACNGDHPLEGAGYACSNLLNKGTGTTIGEAFSRRSGSLLTIYTNLFGALADSGHDEEKICVDDENDPYLSEGSCVGANADDIINDGTLVPAPADQEEGSNLWEFMIEGVQLTEFAGAGAAAGLGGYSVDISTYTYVSLHFNEGDKSIETFFQPPADSPVTKTPPATRTGIPNGTRTAVRTGTPNGTRTAVRTSTAAARTPTPTVTDETETATSTPTHTSTSTATSTPTPGDGNPTVNRRNTPTAEVAGSTRIPNPSATPVNTVLAAEITPTASAIGVSLPFTGGGGSMGIVRDNLAVLLLAMWLIVLVIVGAAVTQRRGL